MKRLALVMALSVMGISLYSMMLEYPNPGSIRTIVAPWPPKA